MHLNLTGELKNLNPMADPIIYPLLIVGVRSTTSGWIRKNQEKFRIATKEDGRRLQRDADRRELPRVGRSVIILPSAFEGGKRHRQRQYLGAMTVITRHGKPDLFFTMTCNPRWPEIVTNLGRAQKWENRPDLKMGGLPHARIVVTMHPNDKIIDVPAVDHIIYAYIPDVYTQPNVYRLVKDFHIHTPCGRLNPDALCMQDNKCKKYYPKAYKKHTTLHAGNNKRPEYKRPNDGRTIYLKEYLQHTPNRRILPYNPYLLAKFHSHINVRVVGSLYIMKYLHKYINKKDDAITLYVGEDNTARAGRRSQLTRTPTATNDNERREEETEQVMVDEIRHYQDFSIACAPTGRTHSGTLVYKEFDDFDNIQRRLENRSKLEAFFKLNREDQEARRYLYVEIPEHYTWDNKNAEWKRRRQVSKQLGCMVEIKPSSDDQIKMYFLQGLTAAEAERKAYEYVEEIVRRNRPHLSLQAIGITLNEERDKENDEEQDDEDQDRRRRKDNNKNSNYDDDLSIFERQRRHQQINNEDEMYSPIHLNPDRKRLFLGIMKTITKQHHLNIPLDVLANISDVVSIDDIQEEIDPNENLFYIDGPGGPGKTHLYNTIITCIKEHFHKTCIAVAWTGIAANLLIDGTTVHRAFKLPLDLTEARLGCRNK
ncbi:unnamed protein product [Psylliodes chrysocephalus]|uniref:ATP-dependent DNA helicase n=1 Tax=Psylliodes chrysocephalus TaxID=3402493 RepID=A0A9P0GH73_9CUCU|nr:unnamed protein product [Psylliodes chrysocephala]